MPARIGTSYSLEPSPVQAAKEAAERALSKAGCHQSNTAVFFATSEHRRHYAEITEEIRKTTGAENVVGSSGYGVLTEEIEIEKQAGLAVMVMDAQDAPSSSFILSDLQENNFRAGERVAGWYGKLARQTSPLLLFPDPFSFQSHLFFDGFEQALTHVPMIGGLSSENGKESKAYQMASGKVSHDAVAGLALGENFRLETGIARSCQPFGEPLRITKAAGNMIYEMEGRPAYDMLLESMAQIELDHPEHMMQRIFLGVPIKSFQTDFATSPYLIRNIMGVNAKKGMLTCLSPVEEGAFVTFAIQDPAYARRHMEEMLEDLRYRLLPEKPALGFYFNSCARGKNLYQEPNVDIRLIQSYFPEIPLVGFFSYGEIAPVDFVNHLHHYSGVLTFLVPQN